MAKQSTKKLVGLAMLTGIVVVLQMLAFIFPTASVFQLNLVLVPIVVGAALYGAWSGAWLGLVSGVIIVLTNAGPFLAVNIIGTVLTCVLKGAGSGLAAGYTYKLLVKANSIVATIAAAIVCPIVNTGIFLLGCWAFFVPVIQGWGFSNVWIYFTAAIMINFLIEVGINVVFSPAIVRILNVVSKNK